MNPKNKFINWPNKPQLIEKYFGDQTSPIVHWDPAAVKAYQLEAVQNVLTHVFENNPYYRAKLEHNGITPKDIRKLEDLQYIDFTTKDRLKNDPDLILSVPRERIAQVFLSTGTTGGDVVYMMHTWEDLFIRDLAPDLEEIFPMQTTDVVLNALPYEMSSAGLSFHNVAQHCAGACVISAGKGGVYSSPYKTIKAMRDVKANILISSPSYTMFLIDVAEELGYEIGQDLKIEKIWLTGEGCSNSFRKRIEDFWRAPAYFYYGSLECGPLGIECRAQNGYHIAASHIYVEIVDPDTGKLLGPGETGEVVVTTLLKEGSPLIRYKTQDLAYIEDTPCECGAKLQRLFLRGRKGEQIRIDGKEYSPYYIEENLMKLPEVGNNYRFVVYDDHIVIETEVREPFKNTPGLEETISSRVEYGCGIPNKVKIIDKISYDGGKAVRVIHKQSK